MQRSTDVYLLSFLKVDEMSKSDLCALSTAVIRVVSAPRIQCKSKTATTPMLSHYLTGEGIEPSVGDAERRRALLAV